MATPLLLCFPLFSSWQRRSVPSLALGVYSCYLMWLELAQPASPQWANTGFLKLFLLKESAGAAGFCEFWHSGCLPGSVPLRFWVCCRRSNGFSDVSCLVPNDFFFSCLVLFEPLIKLMFYQWIWEIWENEYCDEHGRLVGLERFGSGVALSLIGLVSIWYDCAALEPYSCFAIWVSC